MDTGHWHTAVHHTLPSGYVQVHECHPSHNSSSPLSQIPELYFCNYAHNETSINRSDCNGKKFLSHPAQQPAFHSHLYNIHDLNELPFGYRRNTVDLLPVNNQMPSYSYVLLMIYFFNCSLCLQYYISPYIRKTLPAKYFIYDFFHKNILYDIANSQLSFISKIITLYQSA